VTSDPDFKVTILFNAK